MSQGQKLFDRPKVRFSQPSDESSTNSEKLVVPCNYPTTNKPRIRNIVTLEDPFKIIYKKGDLPSTSKANVENTDTQKSSKPYCDAQSSSDANFQKPQTSSYHNTDSKTSNNKPNSSIIQKSLPCTSLPQNSTHKDNSATDGTTCLSAVKNSTQNSRASFSIDNLKNFQAAKSKDKSKDSVNSASKNIAQVKTGAIPKFGKTCAIKTGSRQTTPKTVPSTVEKAAKKVATVFNDNFAVSKNPVHKNTLSKINRSREKTLGKGAVPPLSRNIMITKTGSGGLKISKFGSKTWKTRPKSSPVKKSILRDVTGHPTNVHVGPGIARYYSHPLKINMEKEMPHIRPNIVSGEKLSRPEYNSIMCTIDELRKVQSEKFVTDVEHLPLVYRNLVNEKISAALDFPPDEAIYKNLVDLSVNENQLPQRVTRSKDPEPRHRDMVPKLSDFFTPKYSEEYCTAIQIRPSSPEIFSNWSALAISDKIFGWKHDMDQCY